VITADEFLEDLNETAARYYTNLFLGAPNAEVPKRFWADTRIRVLPYDRGAMYFAEVEEAVRRRTAGRRGLDDLLKKMLRGPRTEQAWRAIVRSELGAEGERRLDEMLGGAEMRPVEFGPCFERVRRPLRRYELGFAPDVLTERPRVVRGLQAGSAAERAGVRDGDEILKPVPQDGVQARQEGWLTLELRRAGRTFAVRYQPRGETVEAYQWRRTAGRCAATRPRPRGW